MNVLNYQDMNYNTYLDTCLNYSTYLDFDNFRYSKNFIQ